MLAQFLFIDTWRSCSLLILYISLYDQDLICNKLNSAAFKHSMDSKIILGPVLISQYKNRCNKTLRSRNSPVSCKFGVAGRVRAEITASSKTEINSEFT